MIKPIYIAWMIATSPLALVSAEQESRFSQIHPAMGTRFEIVLYATTENEAQRGFDRAFARIDELNSIMSDYDPDSELSELSRTSPHATGQHVSPALFHVLIAANDFSIASRGAFDVTVGPLTKLWRRARRQKQMPTDQRIAEAKLATGYKKMQIDPHAHSVRLTQSKMRLDLGGIAKGYAADQALEVLCELGMPCALINAGGDVVCGEPPPDKCGWEVGITPLGKNEEVSYITLCNAAVATSGDAWQYVEIDNVRYSHIVDPVTGLGLTRRGGVTVVALDGITADSLASAFSVMPVDDAMRLAKEYPGVSALIRWIEFEKLRERKSEDFPVLRRD